MLSSTLTSKGQTTIPVEIRKMLKLKPNMKVFWISMKPGEVSVVPAPQKAKNGWAKKVYGLYADKTVDGVESFLKSKKEDMELEKRGFLDN